MKPDRIANRWSYILVTAATIFVLGSCTVLTTKVNAEIQATGDVNADETGRAFPVVVRIYELKSKDAFEAADFFTLDTDDSRVLGGDLLARDEWELVPGERRKIRRELNEETKYLGVVARYREIEKSQWLKVVPIRQLRNNQFVIRIGKRSVSIGYGQ